VKLYRTGNGNFIEYEDISYRVPRFRRAAVF